MGIAGIGHGIQPLADAPPLVQPLAVGEGRVARIGVLVQPLPDAAALAAVVAARLLQPLPHRRTRCLRIASLGGNRRPGSQRHREQTRPGNPPDARFHGFLTPANWPETPVLPTTDVRAPCTLGSEKSTPDFRRAKKKGGLRPPFGITRPGSSLLAPAHLAPPSGRCVARGPARPCGVGGHDAPDWADRAGRAVRAVNLGEIIRQGCRHRIAKIAQHRIDCATNLQKIQTTRNSYRSGSQYEQAGPL
ncbi:hypothetical protein D3C81_1210110 [compost metagenome]